MSDSQVSPLSFNEASPARRLLSGIIDASFLVILIVALGVVVCVAGEEPARAEFSGLTTLLMIIYFVGCEAAWGLTLGKLATRTRVVQTKGDDLSLVQACIRCGARFVPFEGVSLLGGRPWRDRWSGSKVVVHMPSSGPQANSVSTALPGWRPYVAPLFNLFLPGLGHIVMKKYVQGGLLLAFWTFLMFTPWATPLTVTRIVAAVLITGQMWGHRLGWFRMFA